MSYKLGWARRILIWLNIVMVICIIIYFAVNYFEKSDYNKNMLLGMQYEKSKDYEDAYRQFKRLTNIYPEDARVLIHFAKASYMSGKFDEMQEALIKLKKYKADDVALAEYEKLETLLKAEAIPSAELGKIVSGFEKMTAIQKISTLNAYVATQGKDPLGLYFLGNAYMEQEEYLKAIDTYEKTLEIKKDMIPAILNMATAYREIGYYSKAESVAAKALEYSPKSIQAYVVLARTRLNMYDNAKALEYAKKASTELDPNNLDAKAILAVVVHYANLQNDSLRMLSELKKAKYYDYENLKSIVNGKLDFRR